MTRRESYRAVTNPWPNQGNGRMTDVAAMPKFCPNCGTESTGARFCGNCGRDMATQITSRADPVGSSGGTNSTTVDWAGLVILGAGALAIVASFLPWISVTAAFVGTISRNGFDGGGDGIATAAVGILLALLGIAILARSGSAKRAKIGALVCAVALLYVAYVDIQNVNARLGDIDSNVGVGSVGAGLLAVAFAGVMALIGTGLPSRKT
jgi:RNA polymerase subunit RPABC4/transcription elongation factor Spt4